MIIHYIASDIETDEMSWKIFIYLPHVDEFQYPELHWHVPRVQFKPSNELQSEKLVHGEP